MKIPKMGLSVMRDIKEKKEDNIFVSMTLDIFDYLTGFWKCTGMFCT